MKCKDCACYKDEWCSMWTHSPDPDMERDCGHFIPSLPIQYYQAYRKALRDFRSALEKCGPNLRMYGMNNWKGICAMLTCVLGDVELLMHTASMTGYEIPEPYMSKWKKYCEKQREKRGNEN